MTQNIGSLGEAPLDGIRLRQLALQECVRRSLPRIQGWLLLFVLLSVWGGAMMGLTGFRLLEIGFHENTEWRAACLLTGAGLSFILVAAILYKSPKIILAANLIIPVRTMLFLWVTHDLLALRPEQGIFTLFAGLVLIYQSLWLLYFNRSRRVRAVARKRGLSRG